jgi:CHAT domain-containing protein/Tfp pilus assembly protein PilF
MRCAALMLVAVIVTTTMVKAQRAATEPSGLIVEEVNADSAAAKAGLKVGDKLLTFEERPLTSLASLQAIQQNTVGKLESTMRVRRGDEVLVFRVPIRKLGVIVRPDFSTTTLPLYLKARAAQQAEKAAEAISFLTMAAKEAENGGDRIGSSWFYWNSGLLYEDLGKCEEAVKVYDSAWRLIEGSDDTAAQVKVMESLGWCHQNLKNYSASQKWYEQAFQANTNAGYELWAASDLVYLGRLGLATRDFPAARKVLDQSRKIYERLTPGSGDVGSTLGLLGDVAFFSNDFKSAEDYFQRALKINEALDGGSDDTARILDSLGSVYYRSGNPNAAEDYYHRALNIRSKISPGGSREVAGVLHNLGNVAYSRGDLFTAQDFYRQARDMRKASSSSSADYANSLIGLGNVLYAANNPDAAQNYFSDALNIYEHINPNSLDVATALNNLGNIAFVRNNVEAAQDYYQRALKIREGLVPNSLEIADSLGNLAAVAYRRDDFRASETYLRSAMKIRELLAPGSLDLAMNLVNLGNTVVKLGRQREALELFKDSVNIIETQRGRIPSIEARTFLLARYTFPYVGLFETNLALKDLPAAFAVVERARARSLIELLGQRQLDFKNEVSPKVSREQLELNRDRSAKYALLQDTFIKLNGMDTLVKKSGSSLELLEQKKKLEGEMEKLRRDLIQLSVQQRELEATIRRDSSKYASLEYPEPLDLKGAQATLDDGTLLLSYFVGPERTYVFAVTKESREVFTLPIGANGLKDLVRAFRSEVTTVRVDPKVVEQGKSLYDLLIGPAKDSVNRAKRILISPDGPLNTLPFAALVSLTSPRPRYFIEDKPLHTINSMTVYAKMRESQRNKQQQKTLLAFGDSISNLGALKGARDEVQELARLFGPSATVMLGRNATEAVAREKSKEYSILHFAVHGLLDDDVGLNSALVLSKPEMIGGKSSETDNGLWQAWEIFEQGELNADLVMLAACKVGAGENIRGEGLIGLTRAFQYAGARSIVVSLWNVDDLITTGLITTFYQELQKGVSKDVALQRAMQMTRDKKESQHPHYWAEFILTGDWQ